MIYFGFSGGSGFTVRNKPQLSRNWRLTFVHRSFGHVWLSRRQRLSTRQLPKSSILKGCVASLAQLSALPKYAKINTPTKHTTVKFTAPFSLRGVDEIQPPGDYAIDEDEELIDGLSWLTYRRVATFIHLPAVSSSARLKSQVVAIDHSELEAAMRQDENQAQEQEVQQ